MRRKRSSGESFEDSEETQFEKRSTGSNRSDSNSSEPYHINIGHQQAKVQKLKLEKHNLRKGQREEATGQTLTERLKVDLQD